MSLATTSLTSVTGDDRIRFLEHLDAFCVQAGCSFTVDAERLVLTLTGDGDVAAEVQAKSLIENAASATGVDPAALLEGYEPQSSAE